MDVLVAEALHELTDGVVLDRALGQVLEEVHVQRRVHGPARLVIGRVAVRRDVEAAIGEPAGQVVVGDPVAELDRAVRSVAIEDEEVDVARLDAGRQRRDDRGRRRRVVDVPDAATRAELVRHDRDRAHEDEHAEQHVERSGDEGQARSGEEEQADTGDRQGDPDRPGPPRVVRRPPDDQRQMVIAEEERRPDAEHEGGPLGIAQEQGQDDEGHGHRHDDADQDRDDLVDARLVEVARIEEQDRVRAEQDRVDRHGARQALDHGTLFVCRSPPGRTSGE